MSLVSDVEITVATLSPYGGRIEPPHGWTQDVFDLGVARIDERGRPGHEAFSLERVRDYWRLRSQRFGEPWRALASVLAERLPSEPREAAVELLSQVWTLRRPDLLAFAGVANAGVLGSTRWDRVAALLARSRGLDTPRVAVLR